MKKKFIAALTAIGLAISAPLQLVTNAQEETPSVKEDFYQAVNHEWLEENPVPDTAPMWGSTSEMTTNTSDIIYNDITAMAEGELEIPNQKMEEFIELYKVATDFDKREEDGLDAAKPYLDRINSLESFDEFIEEYPSLSMEDYPLPFIISNTINLYNREEKVALLSGPSLILPDKTMYSNDEQKASLLASFSSSYTEALELFGYSEEESSRIVANAIKFDDKLVETAKAATDSQDIEAGFIEVSKDDLKNFSKNVDLNALIEKRFNNLAEKVFVDNDAFYNAFDSIINEENFAEIKDWMLLREVSSVRDLLTEELRTTVSEFDLAISGQTEHHDPYDIALSVAGEYYDQHIGIYYGKKYLGEEARSEITELTKEFVEAYKRRLENNDWLSQETIDKAINKLDNLHLFIGYPDEPAEDIDFTTEYDSLFTFTKEASKTMNQYIIDHWNDPINYDEWVFPAQAINAFYFPIQNGIYFPAGFLQEPVYSKDYSTSQNLGAIGAVIAHEISHAFDPIGSKFDETGNINNWWTDEDFSKFEEKTQVIAEYFDGIETEYGKVDGHLTLGENIADLGGVAVALDVLEHLEEEPNYEEFFSQWAIFWRQNTKPLFASILLILDSHSPNNVRVNEIVKQFEQFHETFDVKEGDPMYLAPDERLTLW